eukprot:5255950-Pleurochrysis_carterae.AAC.1
MTSVKEQVAALRTEPSLQVQLQRSARRERDIARNQIFTDLALAFVVTECDKMSIYQIEIKTGSLLTPTSLLIGHMVRGVLAYDDGTTFIRY